MYRGYSIVYIVIIVSLVPPTKVSVKPCWPGEDPLEPLENVTSSGYRPVCSDMGCPECEPEHLAGGLDTPIITFVSTWKG